MTARAAIPADRWGAAEANLGRMMAASVPPHLRPKAPPDPDKAKDGLSRPELIAARAERLDKARALSGTGKSVEQLAEALGISRGTAMQYARLIGGFVNARPPQGPRPRPRQDQAAFLYRQGVTVDAIALRMGLNPKTVRHYLHEACVKPRKGDLH